MSYRIQIVGGPPPEAFPGILEASFDTGPGAVDMARRIDAMLGDLKTRGVTFRVVGDNGLGLTIWRSGDD